MSDLPLAGRDLVVAVDAAPDAYAAADLVRRLVREGARVRVVVGEETERFLPALTLATVSRAGVVRDMAEAIRLGQAADAVVACAVRDAFLASAAAGRATDAVTAAFVSAKGPRVVIPGAGLSSAPWMAVQLEALSETAWVLAAGISPEEAAATILRACGPRDLAGRRLVITAGPTREAIDPVRFISNPSTGKMGYALAEAARCRGAEVVLLSGPTGLAPPTGVRMRRFVSADDLMALADEEANGADAVVASAAVGDYTPETPSPEKIKKGEGPLVLRLKRTPDVLGTLGTRFAEAARRPVLVGFAAETESLLENARAKLDGKHLDLVVANDVTRTGSGFGTDTNEVVLVDRQGETALAPGSKAEVAHAILDRVVGLLGGR